MNRFIKNLIRPSTIILLGSNIFTIIVAVQQKWPLQNLVWIFWIQSMIIGFFQVRKMLDLKKFTTKNFKINGKPISPTEGTKKLLATFFCIHYGFFHFVYLIVLLFSLPTNIKNVFWFGLLFLLNHTFSYYKNKNVDQEKERNIGHLFSFPYLRIFPMHLIIIIGVAVGGTGHLLIFLLLKTGSDVLMHMAEHEI